MIFEIKATGVECADDSEKPKNIRILLQHVIAYQESGDGTFPTTVYATNGVWNIDVPINTISNLLFKFYKNGQNEQARSGTEKLRSLQD